MEDPQASTTFSDSSYQQIPLNDLSDGHGEDDHDQDDIDSLPSTSATTTSLSPSEQDHISDAEREWKESLQQLELLLTMVLVPYLGKYFGRKAAYWGWAKFMEWKYPVTIEITNPALFKGAGAIEAAATL